MAAALDFLEQLGMTAHVVADEKEGGLDAVVVEQVEHPGRDLGNRAVVESEVDDAAVFMSF